ncbi:MAG: P-loop NTPase fold protein, partial [bacterium]
VYGRWGSGKSSLLAMLKEWLEEAVRRDAWEVVEFSPWMYRQERSLLLPLLATLAKKRPMFQKIVSEIANAGPGLVRMLAKMGFEAAATGLPLVTFLKDLRDKKEKAQDLVEKIQDGVKEITGDDKRLVFLIDDLDRCHDPDQIVGLLEQIKLFLHLDRCLFFIAADREQIIRAIEQQFPGQGREYLNKFVQLAFELPPHASHRLPNLPAIAEPWRRNYFQRLAEVLEANPRRVKQIWNQAVLRLKLIEHPIETVTGFLHSPSVELMLKWLLLREIPALAGDPYRYLDFEPAPQRPPQTGSFHDFAKTLGLQGLEGSRPDDLRRAMFLWHDLHDARSPRFASPRILRLYAEASGEDIGRSRAYIEARLVQGQAEFQQVDFSQTKLSYGQFAGARFIDCNFEKAELNETNLEQVVFQTCQLKDACFNGARIERTVWDRCRGTDWMSATEPVIYERIADKIVEYWHDRRHAGDPIGGWDLDALERMYSTVANQLPEPGGSRLERLQGKAQALLDELAPLRHDKGM